MGKICARTVNIMPKQKILIADDDKDAALFLKKGLQREGFEIVLAVDGQEAKQAILKTNPDLIILDLVMPKLDGWEVLKWLRQQQNKSTPVIVVSAKEEIGDLKKTYALEADTYLVKPITIDDVLAAIRAISSLNFE